MAKKTNKPKTRAQAIRAIDDAGLRGKFLVVYQETPERYFAQYADQEPDLWLHVFDDLGIEPTKPSKSLKPWYTRRHRFTSDTGLKLNMSPSKVKPAYGGEEYSYEFRFCSEWTVCTIVVCYRRLAFLRNANFGIAEVKIESSGEGGNALAQFIPLVRQFKMMSAADNSDFWIPLDVWDVVIPVLKGQF